MQTQLIEAGREPSLLGTVLGSLLVGSVIAIFAQLGLIFLGVARKGLDFTFGKLFKSKNMWAWLVWVNIIVLFFSLMWKYGNF